MTRTRLVRVASLLSLPVALLATQSAVWSRQAAPPLSATQALSTFRLADGFRIDVFAADPLIASPVAMEIDERGHLYVAEMPGYPLDVSGSGRIKRLSDTTGDGRPDTATIFADGLRLPTGIMKWKNGLLVTDSPQVWYLEDADGDGRAEIKRELLTGFALSNPQHTTNTPIYGLDNWVYLANEGPVRTIRYRDLFGDGGGEVHFPDRPGGPRLPPDADGRNVRFRPDTGELEMLSSRSQFGQTFDAWGRHFLVTHNRHMTHEVVAAPYLSRNPSLVVTTAIEQVPDYPLPAALFPITHKPEFQLLTDVGVMTAASGLTYYLGDLFPAEYRNTAFVAEGAHNLIHAVSVREHGATFRARRVLEGREFLASTDAWFRPVNLYVGPDGALYVIDYYRKILEHPEWMAEAIARSKDIHAGRDRGRIYRIAPKRTAPPNWLDRVPLGSVSAEALVQALGRPNLWWRRHAQRLLVDRRPQHVAAPLASMAIGSESPTARVHALWTLDGIGRLEPSVIAQSLRDPTAGVRENAIRLAEIHLPHAPALGRDLLDLAADPDPRVRFQLLLTLGGIATPQAAAVRTRLLFDGLEDDWMQVAALSASALDQSALLRDAVARVGTTETDGARRLFSRIGAMAGASQDVAVVRTILRTLLSNHDASAAWWRSATIAGIATGLPADGRRTADLDQERLLVAGMLEHEQPASLRRACVTLAETIGLPPASATGAAIERAERLVADGDADADARADAVRLLALRDITGYEPLLLGVLARAEPAPVHVAAVRALAEPKGDRITAMFLKLWDRWTPAVRQEVLRTLAREPARIGLLLDALSAGPVRISEIEWPLRVRMMMADDDTLRARARAILARPADTGRKALKRYEASALAAGNATRGREVFRQSCATCHQYRGGSGVAFGPDLGEVRGRLPSALLADILRPNQSIADGYELWVAELNDGTTVTGIIGAETPTSVTFRTAGGGQATVARSRIAAMRIAPMSAMPQGLESQITARQMSDLIAFLKRGQ